MPPNKGPFAILSANIRGLSPAQGKFKIPMLAEKAQDENIGIITITESHLHSNFLEGEIQIKGFTNYRADRADGVRKGGVITYIRDDLLPGTQLKDSGSIGNIEFLVLHMKEINLILITVYRPPTSKPADFKTVIDRIRRVLLLCDSPTPRIAVTGDLNFPSLNWELYQIESCPSETREQAQTLLNFLDDFFLEQSVKKATRLNNILDIFAINDHEFISNIDVENTNQRTSDHRLMIIRTRICTEKCGSKPDEADQSLLASLNFWSPDINWDSIRNSFCCTDWQELMNVPDIDAKAEKLLKSIEDTCAKFVPPKIIKKISIIPRDRRILMRKRKKVRSKLLKTRNQRIIESLELKLETIEALLISSLEDQQLTEENKAIGKINNNPKYFFNYARSKSNIKTPIGPLQDGDSTITNPKDMSEILKSQFESVFVAGAEPIEMDDLNRDQGPWVMSDITFTEDNIEEFIMKIPQNSSSGIDGISALLLRNCAAELKKPIFLLWRASLDAGQLPKYMKTSVVTPIFKGGDRCKPENYRPISLISHLCKILERIIVKALTAYLNEAHLFNEGQHGFRSGRSCLSQLLEHHQKILEALENNAGVDVVYLDFAKAFDRVDYKALLWKLKAIGICGTLLQWLADFLMGRRQIVKVCGSLSSEGPVYSGVPRGSSLGPLLFLIMISDIDNCVDHVAVSSFADDTRVLIIIEKPEDCVKMQDDLIRIYNWATDNHMQFNSKKFELVSYSSRQRNLHQINVIDKVFDYPEYYDPDGKIITSVDMVKDLGVKVCNDATFDAQISDCAIKGSRYASWILRVFRTREPSALMILFKSLVLPHLEYCCPVWSPLKIGSIRQLESIQRNFTSKLRTLTSLNYWERLRALGIYSIERRRERYLILYLYKIIQGLTPNFCGEKFKINIENSARRGRICVIPGLNTRSLTRVTTMVEASFPVRGPKLFNALPMNIRNFDGSVDAFKSRLDKFLATVPDKPHMPAYQQLSTSNSILDQLIVLRAAGIYAN